MTLYEFVRIDPNKIRRDKDLMQLFVDFYKAAFSLEPNCAGCVFKSGFNKLKRYAKKGNFTENKTIMEATFILKPKERARIQRYRENGRTHRVYGYAMTEEFALKMVEHGRQDIFAKLPKVDKKQKEIKETVISDKGIEPTIKADYLSMDWKDEILPLYAQVREKTGKKAESRKKEDIIAFLEENEG